MNHVIRATMLGKFTLMQEGMNAPAVVSLAGRSRRLWTLVAYLILQRARGVSTQELIDLLWPDAEGSNPASTLQNNVSRSRNSLAEMGFERPRRSFAMKTAITSGRPSGRPILILKNLRALQSGRWTAEGSSRHWNGGSRQLNFIPGTSCRRPQRSFGASISTPITVRSISAFAERRYRGCFVQGGCRSWSGYAPE